MKHLAGIGLAFLLVAARQDSAKAVYSDGLKLEGQRKYDDAIKKYERAVASSDKAYGARAQFQIGVCYERMSPPNVASAQSAYDAVVAKYSDQSDVAARAQSKLRLKGVDVYLDVLAAGVDKWRDETPDDRAVLEALRKEAWDKILALGPAGAPGLIWGFTHPEPLIRDFCAENLRTIVDEAGLAETTQKLSDPNPLANATASASLRRIATIYGQAKAVDDRANEMEAKLTKALGEIEDIPPVQGVDQTKIDAFNRGRDERKAQVAKEVGTLRDMAKSIRKNIPQSFDMKGPFVSTLKTILSNTGSLVEARIEAARMLDSIGELRGDVIEALMKALDEPSSELRADAARTLGSIAAEETAERQKAATKLQAMVQYEPEKETDNIDWRNTGFVRANAAYALGGLGIITAVPALLEALDDNDSAVRDAANKALIRLCNGDRAADSKNRVPGFAPNAPKDKRAEAIARWKKWWDETGGVEVLIERYRDYAGDNANYDTAGFYDANFLERRMKAREILLKNDTIWNDVKAAMDQFNRGKEIIQRDVVALGDTAVKELLKYIGGEFEGVAVANASVRMFVAECLAKIAESSSGAIDQVREVLLGTGGPTKYKQIGAAYALGIYSNAGAREFDALTKLGLGNADYGVKEAAARALGMRPKESHVADLAAALRALHEGRDSKAEGAMVAMCAALGRIKAQSPDALQALGLVARGPSPVDLARESAAFALGEIGSAKAVDDLVFSRTDMFLNVRLAAREAFVRLASDGSLMATLGDKMKYAAIASEKVGSSSERRGAALGLGDVVAANPGNAKAAVQNLMGALRGRGTSREERRKYPRDPDPGVRAGACEALGAAMSKARPSEAAMHELADRLNDEADDVRKAAHLALAAVLKKDIELSVPVAEGQPDYKGVFKSGLPEPARLAFAEAYHLAITEAKGGMDPE